MEKFQNIHFLKIGDGQRPFFWGHGWGQSHKSFQSWAERFAAKGTHYLIDFPGFGDSPVPDSQWGTADYADAMADLIRAQTSAKIIWVGHSFGCRVGLQLAARHPDLIAGLFLVAGAGLPRKRPLLQELYFKGRIKLFKLLKKLIPFGLPEAWLMKTFASADYKSAGPLRSIFVRVVNEDLTDICGQITCPVTLLYGAQDTETPPEIGYRLEQLIDGAKMIALDNFDHYTILTSGAHQAAGHLDRLITLTEPQQT